MNASADSGLTEGVSTPGREPVASARREQSVPAALRLFASIFQREVDERLLKEIETRRQELAGVLGGDPLAGLEPGNPGPAVEVLAVEYCRLFIGPHGHLPPVESVVCGEECFWGPSTEKVADFYRSAAMAPSSDRRELPDHISMELDCLALLEETDRHHEATVFAREHVLRWLPDLAQHVDRRSTVPFYRVWSAGLKMMLAELYGG